MGEVPASVLFLVGSIWDSNWGHLESLLPPSSEIPALCRGSLEWTHSGSGSQDLPETSLELALSTSRCGALAALLSLSDLRLHLSKVEIVPALSTSQGFENCRGENFRG